MSYKNYILYKIYYGNELVYIGRTSQDLIDRLRLHFFGKPMVKKLDVIATTRIEYTVCDSEADMFLLEIYLINKYKPRINRDDKAHDELSSHLYLPEPKFYSYYNPLLDKWKEKEIEHIVDTAPLDYIDGESIWF
jgi:hypothetical protein